MAEIIVKIRWFITFVIFIELAIFYVGYLYGEPLYNFLVFCCIDGVGLILVWLTVIRYRKIYGDNQSKEHSKT